MMKLSSLFALVGGLALCVSCEKPQTDAEKTAQIEREVQQRLAAEHQTADQERLAQQQADLDAREKALAAKESATGTTTDTTEARVTPRATPRVQSSSRVSSAAASTPSSYDTFYRKLEPYGAWRETVDYGYVWQPREAQRSRDWRPYTDGRWAYTDAGWTWVSDEPFGWATYHYGRWSRLSGVGWVWVPGEEWAPAWVSWRKSDQHVGWAPLPPEARFEHGKGIHKWADSYYDIDADEYVFIPNEDIGAENVQRSVIPMNRNVAIVEETTNVTNITYNNTTIVNEGPSFDDLRERSRRPLERMRIEREYDVEREQKPQATVRGEVLQMMTPLFAARASERPRTEGPRLQQTTVERNWAGGGNNADAERARAKMKSEATPPPDAPAKRAEKVVVVDSAATPASVASAAPVTSASPSGSPVASPEHRHSPSATTVPVATATSTPVPTVIPSATPKPSTPTPTAVATATPTPIITPAPTVAPTATPARQTPTATPVATVTPTPVATASPRATAVPVSTPVATVAATAPPPVIRKPRPTPLPTTEPPGLTTPAPDASNGNPQESAAAARAEQMRKREELRNARGRDTIRSLPPVSAPVPPVVAPRAVTPLPSVTPDTTSTSTLPATRPEVAAAQRGLPEAGIAPSPTATPAANVPRSRPPVAPVPPAAKPVTTDEAASAATPAEAGAKPVVRPGRRLPPDAEPKPTPTPSAANEP